MLYVAAALLLPALHLTFHDRARSLAALAAPARWGGSPSARLSLTSTRLIISTRSVRTRRSQSGPALSSPPPGHHTPSYTVPAAWRTLLPATSRRRTGRPPFAAHRPRRCRLWLFSSWIPAAQPLAALSPLRSASPLVAWKSPVLAPHKSLAAREGAPRPRTVPASRCRARFLSLLAQRWLGQTSPQPPSPAAEEAAAAPTRPCHPSLACHARARPRRIAAGRGSSVGGSAGGLPDGATGRFPRRSCLAQCQSRLRPARRRHTQRWWSPIVRPQRGFGADRARARPAPATDPAGERSSARCAGPDHHQHAGGARPTSTCCAALMPITGPMSR